MHILRGRAGVVVAIGVVLFGGTTGCDCAAAPLPVRDGALEDAGGDTGPGRTDGGMDAGRDAELPDVLLGPDGGAGLECAVCTVDADCGGGSYCVELAVGDRVCLRSCNEEIPDCPPR